MPKAESMKNQTVSRKRRPTGVKTERPRTGIKSGRRRAAQPRSLARFLNVLRAQLPEISERYHVRSLGVFGSYVRHEQKPRSDLDVLVEFDDDSLSLIQYLQLENYLSDLLGVRVDLVEKQALKPQIGQRILQEVVPV